MRTRTLAFLVGCLLAAPAGAADLNQTMALLQRWIGGNYSTQAQHDADQASAKPDTEKHRLMFQLFQRVDAPGISEVVFFEQGSRDGSTDPDMIWRSALVELVPDPALGVVRYRELMFKDQKQWHNAHKTPERFKALTRADVMFDPDCDFLVSLNAAGTEIAGPIPKMQCSRMNEGTGERMYADDKIVVKPGEFWFLGRYVNAKGEHVWGNESDELNKLVRFADVP